MAAGTKVEAAMRLSGFKNWTNFNKQFEDFFGEGTATRLRSRWQRRHPPLRGSSLPLTAGCRRTAAPCPGADTAPPRAAEVDPRTVSPTPRYSGVTSGHWHPPGLRQTFT